jgi:hypothetical protein
VLPICNQYLIAFRLGCSFREAMAGSLPVTRISMSLSKVALVEVDRSEVYSGYNNSPRIYP